MYGLVEFKENEEGFSVAEASAAMTAIEEVGLKIRFADDLLELVTMAYEGTNPEELEEYKAAMDSNKERYAELRRDLNGGWADDAKNMRLVQVKSLIDIAEALTSMSGISH